MYYFWQDFYDNNNVAVYQRIAKDNKSLVIINGSTKVEKVIKLEYINGKTFKDLLNNEEITFNSNKVNLKPGQFFILKEL